MKMFIFALAAIAFTSPAFAAGMKYDITCAYNDKREEKDMAKFALAGTYIVEGKDEATLDFRATLVLGPEMIFTDEAGIVFAHGKLDNMDYNGRKYNNHFKFGIDWKGVDTQIEWGNLIISKEPISVTKDQYGATIRTFDGALDVSYNDHHGDYVKVLCTDREFED